MSCKEDLGREFEMKYMGLRHFSLGMEVWQKDGEVFVSQGKYANEILRRFHVEKCKPTQNPLAGNWRKEDGTSGERMDPTVIYYDNQSCIKLYENPVFHDRSKHIDICYHQLRDCVARKIMLLQYILTEEQDADILTKGLSKCKFEFHRDKIEVTDNPFIVEREC
eukprot:PITA_36661